MSFDLLSLVGSEPRLKRYSFLTVRANMFYAIVQGSSILNSWFLWDTVNSGTDINGIGI